MKMTTFFAVVAGCAWTACGAGEVRTWPAQEIRVCSAMAMKVNGRPVDVWTLPAPTHAVSGADAQPYFAAFFEADEEVEIEVEETEPEAANTRILPLSRGVRPQIVDARTIRFRAKPPFTLSVEPSGRHRALVVSASLPDPKAPRAGDPGVVYFGPGRHRPKDVVRLASNQTLYLAPGAYVEGAVSGSGTNITICGKGILSGAPWPWCKGPSGHMCSLAGRNITVRDVTLMSAWQWCLVLHDCEDVVVENVKILNGRVLNDDGIDVCAARRVKIRDCFIRAQDDCITPKWWCEDLVVENCALWTDCANIFRIGYECAGKDRFYRNLRFRHIDVLHQSMGKRPSTEYWSNHAIFIQPANDQRFENFLFEDLRFDTPEAGDLFLTVRTFMVKDAWQNHTVAGHFRGLTIRDVHFPPLAPNTMEVRLESHDPEHAVADVAFENVTGCGALVVAGEVKDVKIPQSSFARRVPVTKWKTGPNWIADGNALTAKGPSDVVEADVPVATGGVFSARLRLVTPPVRASDPTTFGLRFKGPDGYWGLSFWRQPGTGDREGLRRFEFEEMREGKRCVQNNLIPLYARGGDSAWEFGETYVFTLRLTDERVEATVFDEASA